MLVTSIFSFSHNIFNRLLSLGSLKVGINVWYGVNPFANKPVILSFCGTSLLRGSTWLSGKVFDSSSRDPWTRHFRAPVLYWWNPGKTCIMWADAVIRLKYCWKRCKTTFNQSINQSLENSVGKRANFSSSHSTFDPFRRLSTIFVKSETVVCKLFQFERFLNLLFKAKG